MNIKKVYVGCHLVLREFIMDQKIPLSGRNPDINQLRQTLFGGQANYVPALELLHDIEVKEAFLGRQISSFSDDVEFYPLAGYDY